MTKPEQIRARNWLPAIFATFVVGCVVGLGIETFIYAKGASYLTNDPKACMNCHVMREQFDGWLKGSHKSVAVCNDCHTPHNLVGKYATKALNGFFHSLAFTTQNFHEPIQIKERNKKITEQSCRSCHANVVSAIDNPAHRKGGELSCLGCHRDVGHMH